MPVHCHPSIRALVQCQKGSRVPSRHGRESYDGLGGLVKECCMLLRAATPDPPNYAVHLEAGAECELPDFVSALHPSLRLNICQYIPAGEY